MADVIFLQCGHGPVTVENRVSGTRHPGAKTKGS
jgi:hypothetical protein